MRGSQICRLVVHKLAAIAFQISHADAVRGIETKYGTGGWFGASNQFLTLQSPASEFVPFFYCKGSVRAVFTATVSYSDAGSGMDSHDPSRASASSTRYVSTQPLALRTTFNDNQMQLYGGYKYNIRHIQSALQDEENPLRLRDSRDVDFSGATINLFEQSIATLKELLLVKVTRQAEALAQERTRAFHPTASSIAITFTTFDMQLEEVLPVLVPCYVVKVEYDSETYNVYVNGATGVVAGPLLINALHVGRAAALATSLGVLVAMPNKVLAVVLGSLLSVVTYHVAFYAGKYYPRFMRDRARRQRVSMQAARRDADGVGFQPEMPSSRQRISEAYRRSSYWDTHAFQSKKASNAHRALRDPKGYYKTLGLRGDESVNEIRSAFRRCVLTEHPDAGGSTARMAQLNEAYRVLRDPQRREEYDQL